MVLPLAQEVLLELLPKAQVLLIDGGKLLLADDRGKAAGVLHLGVAGKELVADGAVVHPGVPLADAVLHQAGKAGQHRDGGIHPHQVQAPVQHNLPLGDVPRKVRHRVGDVVVGHGEDGDLCHRAVVAVDHPRPLVEGGQVGIEVAGVALPAGDLPLGGGELPQRLGVGGHIGEDDQHVHILLKGQVFRHRQGAAGGQDTLDDGVVAEVEEHDHVFHHAAGLKGGAEVIGHVVFNTHGGKDDAELGIRVLLAVLGDPGLADNLHRQLVVVHAGAGEDGQLLPPDQGHQGVDGGDAGADVVAGVGTGHRVDGLAVDVPVDLGEDLPQPVDGLAAAAEDAAQHLRGKGHLHGVAQQPGAGVGEGEAGGALKHLDHRLVPLQADDTPVPDGAVLQLQVDHLLKAGVLNMVQHHQRAIDLLESYKLNAHRVWPSFLIPGPRRRPCPPGHTPWPGSARYPACTGQTAPACRWGCRTSS